MTVLAERTGNPWPTDAETREAPAASTAASAVRTTGEAGAVDLATAEPDGPQSPDRPPGRHRRARGWALRWRLAIGRAGAPADEGMATAEYAIVTVAAVAFAGLLIVVLRSDEVRGLLMGIIRGALSV